MCGDIVCAMKYSIDDETRYKLLNLLHKQPDISQRKLADEMGVSLGKVNYCVKALLDVGYVKLNNFTRSKNKLAYAYVLTPKGLKEKATVTLKFLEIKKAQYEQIQKDIAQLQREVLINQSRDEDKNKK